MSNDCRYMVGIDSEGRQICIIGDCKNHCICAFSTQEEVNLCDKYSSRNEDEGE